MLLVLFQPTDVLRAKGVNGGLCMRSKFEFYGSSDSVDVKIRQPIVLQTIVLPIR